MNRLFDKFIKATIKIAVKNKKDVEELLRAGETLLESYKKQSYIHETPLDMLNMDNCSLIPLIEYLLNNRDRIPSPLTDEKNPDWILKSSFCFFNVRATSNSKNSLGNLIDAIKILSSLRVDSIHLAPFFESSLGVIYSVTSFNVIDKEIVNKEYLKMGLSEEEQLRIFIDFAHLLNMSVGFDLEPHMSQFSRVFIENPNLVRWIKLDEKRDGLFDNMSQDEILERVNQVAIHTEVNEIRDSILTKYNLKKLDDKKTDETVYFEIINKLIENGLWTIPSHTWRGRGLPRFTKYNKEKSYPMFDYTSWEGDNHNEHAFGILAPFKFFDNIPINELPDPSKVTPDTDVIDFFNSIFPKLQKKYNFDFIRFDFVDHMFESIINDRVSKSDRVTPQILKQTISKARRSKKYIGAMAERMGSDLKKYKKYGFDLILGDDVLSPPSIQYIKNLYKQNKKIESINFRAKRRASILFTIDTQDTGNPLINCVPYNLYGYMGMAFRFFLSRFSGSGNSFRPKYEAIGNQDSTVGLYDANTLLTSIEWKNDKNFNDIYHNIEDTFDEFKPVIEEGYLDNFETIKSKICKWEITSKGRKLTILVNPSLENGARNISIPKESNYKNITLIDPYKGERRDIGDGEILIKEFKPLEAYIVSME